MRVTVEQSGGFAGLMIKRAIDTQSLSPTEAQQLEQLVNDSNFFQLNSIAERSPQPDRFGYTLTVEKEGRSHSIELSETNLPDSLRPLMEWVQERSR